MEVVCIRYFSGILTGLLISFNILAQPAVDGFMKGKGMMDIVPGFSFESYSNYYGSLNETTPIQRSTMALSLFSAAGLTNWLDIQVSVPYISTKPEFSGLQDFSSYLKFSILNKGFESGSSLRVMLTGGVSFPMSDYNTENLFSIGQQATALDGRLVIQLMKSNGFFIMTQGGITSREDPVPSSYPAALKIGWAKAEKYIDVYYDQQIAVGGNDYLDYSREISDNGTTDITFRSLGVSYGKLGATYYRPIGSSSGFALGASYVLWGRNVGQAVTFSAAFIQKVNFASK